MKKPVLARKKKKPITPMDAAMANSEEWIPVVDLMDQENGGYYYVNRCATIPEIHCVIIKEHKDAETKIIRVFENRQSICRKQPVSRRTNQRTARNTDATT